MASGVVPPVGPVSYPTPVVGGPPCPPSVSTVVCDVDAPWVIDCGCAWDGGLTLWDAGWTSWACEDSPPAEDPPPDIGIM